MQVNKRLELTLGAAAVAGAAAASYAAYVGSSWIRFGHPEPPLPDEADPLLDLFMPKYDVAERHNICVRAPAEATYTALANMNLDDSPIVRAIFKARAVLLGAREEEPSAGRGLIEATKRLGWVVLAEVPGHEIVMGAATQPWEPDVVFRGIPPEQFAAFDEPGYVKVVWTLRADAAGERGSVARSETRAVATDAAARRKFRWYWARFSPGIVLIRGLSMRLVRKDAERRAAVEPLATEPAEARPV